MITLDPVVLMLLGVMKRIRKQVFNDGLQRLGHIGDRFVGFPVSGQRAGEELASGRDVTLGDT